MVEKHWVPNHFLPILPVDNDCSGVVEIENGHDGLNLPKCDDIFYMLFDLQNIDSTENYLKHVDIEIGKQTKTETRMEQENNKIRTKMNFEDIQVKNETVFEENEMETENYMENQQRDIENDLETTSAAPDDVAFTIEEFTVGQFVYVEYDDQNYPVKILKLNESLKELYVQCIKKVNKNSSLYMWPRKKDFCWFPLDAVNKIIPPPRFIDGTNHYTMEWLNWHICLTVTLFLVLFVFYDDILFWYIENKGIILKWKFLPVTNFCPVTEVFFILLVKFYFISKIPYTYLIKDCMIYEVQLAQHWINYYSFVL